MNQGNKQYRKVQIKTANKGNLILLLYRGAIKFMNKAIGQLESKDLEGKGNSLIRAQDIVLELMYSLDDKMLGEGNPLAVNLQSLYLYAYRRLVHANVHMDPKPIEEVITLLQNLLDAWEKVVASEGSGAGDDSPGGSGKSTMVLTG
jgi:flagellar protein FliS